MVDAKNRNMHKYKKTNLVLVLTVLITVLFQGFAKAEIIKWTNCKTIEDPFSESLWKILQETQETKIPFDKEKWIKDEKGVPIQITEGLGRYRLWKAAADVKRSGLPKSGAGELKAILDTKTGMSRAIARQLLLQDTRLKLPEEVLISLRTGSKGADPLDLMAKYYGRSMTNFDEFLNTMNLEGGSPRDLATRVLSEVELIPQFASGGLARILEL